MNIKNSKLIFMALVFLLCLSVIGFGCNFIVERQSSDLPPEVNNAQSSENNNPEQPSDSSVPPSSGFDADLPPEFDIIIEAWRILAEDYVDKDELDAEKLSQGAVKGMLEALDDAPSYYVDPDAHQLELNNLKGQYQGIGAYVSIRDRQLMIIAPIDDSPAERSGIKAGDKILEIDGEDTSKMNLIEAVLKIQGPKGIAVDLLILHDGENEPVEIEIIRDEIKLESVITEMHDDIAHIRLTQFLQSSGDDLEAALKDVIKKGAGGIVLDLRNNPGGLLNISVDVASQFLASGIVVDLVDNEGKHSPLMVKKGGIATHLPLIILVNGGSASASEIIAGALQDYERAKLAGSKTFGKGSAQVVRNMEDGSSLHITVARWFTPLGRPIDGVGITPDFVLDLEDEELVEWAIDYLKN